MSRVRFLAPSADQREGKEGTVYGAGHETDYDPEDYEYVKGLWLEGKAELLDGIPPPIIDPDPEVLRRKQPWREEQERQRDEPARRQEPDTAGATAGTEASRTAGAASPGRAAPAVITLAQLEQEVARRTGPFFQASQDSGVPTSSTTTAAYMPTLRSSAILGGPENLWLLRRGVLVDGSAIPVGQYDSADRIRMVQTFDSSAGRIVVDRNWRNPMVPSELADFTHLHPQQELRAAVMAGLRRCFLAEVLPAVITSGYGDVDLTFQYPWLTGGDQVVRVQYGWTKPFGDAPFDTARMQGHVMLTGAWGSYAPCNVWVTALRPAWSWVNDAESAGPTLDSDQLAVDLDYAAAAGHIEAWHLFPSHLFAAAAGNLQATQEMAAREFTRQALIWGPEPNRRVGFTEVVGAGSRGIAL